MHHKFSLISRENVNERRRIFSFVKRSALSLATLGSKLWKGYLKFFKKSQKAFKRKLKGTLLDILQNHSYIDVDTIIAKMKK